MAPSKDLVENSELISLKHTSKMNAYDEDINLNKFFQTLVNSHSSLFNECVEEKWLICIPRRESLPKYAFTAEDFFHHILKPIDQTKEITICEHNNNNNNIDKEKDKEIKKSKNFTRYNSIGEQNEINLSDHSSVASHWNFRTLTNTNIEYSDQKLTFDVDAAPNSSDDFSNLNSSSKNCKILSRRSIPVLFEETFYTSTSNRKKYKILCIASPINSIFDHTNSYSATIELWNLTSLRDCIDFLWLKGGLRVLESLDAHIKLFLNDHRAIESLPLGVQKDLVNNLYLKCLHIAITCANYNFSSSSLSSHSGDVALKLATETYILNGIYKQLMPAIVSSIATEDSHLNKIIRNLADILPQDLDIDTIHWNNLTRARHEISRFGSHTTALGKIICLKRTLRHLRPDPAEIFENTVLLSADDLLPIWVYLIIKSSLGNWLAQLQFLKTFRFSTHELQNESLFLISTLEAAISHLLSGKVLGMERDERDVGVSFELGEAWLASLHKSIEENKNNSSFICKMFTATRQGNSVKLKELIEDFEIKRELQNKKIKKMNKKEIKASDLCHPLCNCEKCQKIINPVKIELSTTSAVELKSDEEHLTVLHMACIYGRPKIVDYLISIDTPIEVQDSQGKYPIHYAASRGHQNNLLLLLHAKANLEPLDFFMNTPMHLAAQNGHESIVKALIYYSEHTKQSINLSSQNFNGDTPLHFASRWGFQTIATILVEHGAAIKIPNGKKITPMDCAHDLKILQILQMSLRRRSFVQNNHGDFINVDMLKKPEGVVMLISEPKEERDQNKIHEEGEENEREDLENSLLTSSSSTQQLTVPVPHTNGNGFARKTSHSYSRKSSFISSSITPIAEENGEDGNNYKAATKKLSLFAENVYPAQPETLRTVSVESLDILPPHLLAQNASMGMKRKRENLGKNTRKLYNAISSLDIPLFLFYMGIPGEELEKEEIKGNGVGLERISFLKPCHPLCDCVRCVAKAQGLGLDVNVNLEGWTSLHLAIKYNLPTLIKVLYRYGADLNKKTKYEKKTPLQFAQEINNEEIVVLLKNLGCEE